MPLICAGCRGTIRENQDYWICGAPDCKRSFHSDHSCGLHGRSAVTTPERNGTISLPRRDPPGAHRGGSSRRPLLIGLAVFGAVIAVGLIAALAAATNHSASQPTAASQKAEAAPSSGSSSSSSSPDEKLRAAVQSYYEAVDRGDWNYTYDHLDSQTQRKFTKAEWVQKNQFFANQCPGEQSTPKIGSGSSSSEVNVAVTLTFNGCPTKYRTTSFVNENGDWKHRFLKEELDLFMPGTSYDKFVQANS